MFQHLLLCAFLVHLLWSAAASAQEPAGEAGARVQQKSAPGGAPSDYFILRAHLPASGAPGVQAATGRGRYIANFGSREGVHPGAIFQVFGRGVYVGLVRVSRVWRDSAEVRLLELVQKLHPDSPFPLEPGYNLKPRYVVLESVLFNMGKPELSAKMHQRLRYAARLILSFPAFPVVLEGHTDSSGDEKKNLELSEARARQVRAYLHEVQRIPLSQMHPKGYGSSRPIASNETEAGRHRNRRVDVVLVDRLE